VRNYGANVAPGRKNQARLGNSGRFGGRHGTPIAGWRLDDVGWFMEPKNMDPTGGVETQTWLGRLCRFDGTSSGWWFQTIFFP